MLRNTFRSGPYLYFCRGNRQYPVYLGAPQVWSAGCVDPQVSNSPPAWVQSNSASSTAGKGNPDVALNHKNDSAFASLRQFTPPARDEEKHCELCRAEINDHAHLLELKTRQVVCACEACASLLSGEASETYRRIPREVRALPGFRMQEDQWEALAIPINMAFFCTRANSDKPTAFYPSPAGATESLLAVNSWRNIAANNPDLQSLEPDVECLLVNRVTRPYEYYVVPIDECYRLVGLIRTRWRGFSGGTEVWRGIGAFFMSLRARSGQAAQAAHAGAGFSD
jgi:hypothetical protein